MMYKLILETGFNVPANFDNDEEAIRFAETDLKIIMVKNNEGKVIWERPELAVKEIEITI